MVSRKNLARAGAVVAALGATLTLGLVGNSPVSADPKQLESVIKAGVGSDTTQDITNAFAGFNSGINYEPIQGGTTLSQVISFDATGSNCITTKLGGPSFNRPNGSSAGQRALSRAIDAGGYGNTVCGAVPANVAGQVNFARSSALDGTAGTALSYVPFARDGLSFAYYRAAGSPVTSLTRAQLNTIYTAGELTVGGVRIIPCGIQTSSGTHATWLSQSVGVDAATEDAATEECRLISAPERLQENEGPSLIAKGAAIEAASPGTQVIIGFSAGGFITKANGLGTPNPGAVRLGSISDDGAGNNLGAPASEVSGQWVPSVTFNNNATFGRTVYNVVQASLINSGGATNLDLKGLFRGATSAVCVAVAELPEYGFTAAPDCGDTTTNLRGLRSGQL